MYVVGPKIRKPQILFNIVMQWKCYSMLETTRPLSNEISWYRDNLFALQSCPTFAYFSLDI